MKVWDSIQNSWLFSIFMACQIAFSGNNQTFSAAKNEFDAAMTKLSGVLEKDSVSTEIKVISCFLTCMIEKRAQRKDPLLEYEWRRLTRVLESISAMISNPTREKAQECFSACGILTHIFYSVEIKEHVIEKDPKERQKRILLDSLLLLSLFLFSCFSFVFGFQIGGVPAFFSNAIGQGALLVAGNLSCALSLLPMRDILSLQRKENIIRHTVRNYAKGLKRASEGSETQTLFYSSENKVSPLTLDTETSPA